MSKSCLGSYNFTPVLPKGAKFVVQNKHKAADGFIMTQILQNVGPGPAKYSKRGPVGCTHGTIGNTKRFLNIDDLSASPGPDIYNPHKRMTDTRISAREKNSPNCRFGTAKKHQALGPATPGPQNYYSELCLAQIGDKQSVKVPFTTA
jgi:hypothetical protein